MPSRRWFLVSATSLTVMQACNTRGTIKAAAADRVTATASPTDDDTTGELTEPTDAGTSTDTGTEPTGSEPTEDEPTSPWAPGGTLDEGVFPWGVQTGDATPTGVFVSVRSLEPEVRMVLAEGRGGQWVEILTLSNLPADRNVVQVEVVDLRPDTVYAVVFFVPGDRRSRVARFRTALAAGTSRVLRFGATSCLGGNEPWSHLSEMAARRLDFFCLLGDTIYADAGVWEELDHEASWDDALQVGGLRDITASTSVVAIWDDHEVDNNWSWDDPGMVDTVYAAAEAFRRAMPQRTGPAGSGFWRKLSWGDTLDILALDCRGERVNGDYISREQMDWLKAALSQSTATFKIILNSVPICDMDDVYFGLGAEDRWDGYPGQRSELLDHIVDRGITGVLFLSGDFHWGAIAHVSQAGGPYYDVWDVFCGPGGSSINPIGFLAREGDHYEKVATRHNSVEFVADPVSGTIHVAFVDDRGQVFKEQTLQLA